VAKTYKPSGQYEWGVAYTPLAPEGSVFLKAVEETEAKNTYARSNLARIQAKARASGERESRHLLYIPSPKYLFVEPSKGGALDKLDKHWLHGEVVTFARSVAALDKMSVTEIKG
jgi:hypothetical protein